MLCKFIAEFIGSYQLSTKISLIHTAGLDPVFFQKEINQVNWWVFLSAWENQNIPRKIINDRKVRVESIKRFYNPILLRVWFLEIVSRGANDNKIA